MKKLLTLTALCALLTAPATAVQKCVALDAGSSVVVSADGPMYSHVTNGYDWSVTFENATVVRGIAVTSDMSPSSSGGITEELTTDKSSNIFVKNKYCWCRMIYPAVSAWVYLAVSNLLEHPTDPSNEMFSECAARCANSAGYDRSFRQKLFSNL